MPLESLIHHYGYIALFVACFIQSDTLLIVAGIYAKDNTLSLYWVILCATIASFAGDLLFYLIGYFLDAKILQRFPLLEARSQRIMQLLKRFDILFMILVRFLYGLRVLGPVILGISQINLPRFLFYNLIGAILWATCFSLLGYVFGNIIFAIMRGYNNYFIDLLAIGCALIAVGYYYYFHLRNSKKK